MKIFIASDHGGFKLKEEIKEIIEGQVLDLGPQELDPEDDYPQFAFRVAEKVSQEPNSIALLFCRSGSGMVIAANKVKGVRAVDIYNQKIAEHAVKDNHANVFAFGADFLAKEEILACLSIILRTQPDQDERHLRRIKQITDYENKHAN
ncbi:MAG: RpiB/LacA/LacB family sugar-phosphate isomerase [Candidatus Pacebacteria bacterium]|nr:RpiB/LacA/LacB family sugar-phosphate isomerase [Candidatus Paceibacterota bacterium]